MQLKLHMVTIEDLVPQGHFLRKLEAALDLSFVYETTSRLYSHKYGRPPIDPVILVKYLLVGYLYGIPSERQIEQRIQTDVALRWYLGLDLFDAVPAHSTISQLRRRKPSFRKVFRRLFEDVVRQCVVAGLASGRLVGTDSTHVKANASRASEYLAELPEEPGVYWEYWADRADCQGCPLRAKCLSEKDKRGAGSCWTPTSGLPSGGIWPGRMNQTIWTPCASAKFGARAPLQPRSGDTT